jgi:hypothetical protein
MSSQNTSSTKARCDAANAGGDERVLTQRLAGLDRLVEVGHRIIAAIALQMAALTGTDRWDRVFELEGVYDRINWALRLLVRLKLKLARDAKLFDRALDDEKAETPEPAETERREGLDRESGDRFDLDGFDRILKRPPEEVIDNIRRELGATPEWRDWVEAALAGDASPTEVIANETPVVEPLQGPRWRQRTRARLGRSRGQRPIARAGPS